MLQKGNIAPDFNLKSTHNKEISLSSFQGKSNVIIAFYPGDKTPVCTNQLAFYNELTEIFKQYDAKLLAINNESIESHKEFADELHLDFPLLADESNTVLNNYDVYDEESKGSARALYVIDKKGKIHWSYLSPINSNPGADGILHALETIPSYD